MSDMSDIGTVHQISTNPFSIDWVIDDYFRKPQKAYIYLESPPFTFGEAIWHLRLFPNGLSIVGTVEVFLKKVQSFEREHDISCTIGIKDRKGAIFTCGTFSNNIQGCCPMYGNELIKRSTLQSLKSHLVSNNTLTIFVEDLVLNNKQYTDLYCKPQILQVDKTFSTGIEVLSENLKDLLLNKEGCDVTFKIRNIEIEAHRPVLISRSPVFASMLRHKVSETIGEIIEIPDCTPDAFKVLLLYLYSGTVENLSAGVIYDLYEAAIKHGLEDLKMECIQFMKGNLSSDTLYDTLALSKKHKESELFVHITNYFTVHALDILLTMKWQLFLKEDPITANELYIKALQKKCSICSIVKGL